MQINGQSLESYTLYELLEFAKELDAAIKNKIEIPSPGKNGHVKPDMKCSLCFSETEIGSCRNCGFKLCEICHQYRMSLDLLHCPKCHNVYTSLRY